MSMHTVKQLASLSGVSVRTLHYYDERTEHCLRKTPPGDAELNRLVARHRNWVASMWGKPCSPSRYAGLADLYESHPDFRVRYETLAPGLADYLPAVMRVYAGSVPE